VSWNDTLRLLEFEIEALDGSDVVIGIGLRPSDIRFDGMPKANAATPAHPGVEISFESRYGRLTYATDVFVDWHDNVRAIAKGLEALRSVERWGVSSTGEQYAGFAQLTSGGPDPSADAARRRALRRRHPEGAPCDAPRHPRRRVHGSRLRRRPGVPRIGRAASRRRSGPMSGVRAGCGPQTPARPPRAVSVRCNAPQRAPKWPDTPWGRLRGEKSWSLRQLEARTGINAGVLSRIERGFGPSPDQARKLLAAYDAPREVET
jgi:hypothetical protein